MTEIIRGTDAMTGGMTPLLREGLWCFVTFDDPAHAAVLIPEALAGFREDEGLSLLLPLDVARAEEFDVSQPMACITLKVYSSVYGVGLTAAITRAMAEAGIPCNIVSAFHHDHMMVPAAHSGRAMEILTSLQGTARR